jgi:hypothetical protein
MPRAPGFGPLDVTPQPTGSPDARPGRQPLSQGPGLPLLAAADLQDHLMVASNDMERLQRLLGDACDTLLTHFYGATGELKHLLHRVASHPEVDAHELHKAMEHMAGAITAMQFQDMAAQLVDHTTAACATAPTASPATPWVTTTKTARPWSPSCPNAPTP